MDKSKIGTMLENYLQDSFAEMWVSEEDAIADGRFTPVYRPFTVNDWDIEAFSEPLQLLGDISLQVYDVYTAIFAHKEFRQFTGFKVVQLPPSTTHQSFGIELLITTNVK